MRNGADSASYIPWILLGVGLVAEGVFMLLG